MHYEVEINVARKGRPAIYRRVEEADGSPAKWADRTEAAIDMMREGRSDFRVVHVPHAGEASDPA